MNVAYQQDSVEIFHGEQKIRECLDASMQITISLLVHRMATNTATFGWRRLSARDGSAYVEDKIA